MNEWLLEEMSRLEDEIALRDYGMSYNELDEDERESVTWEMQDMLGIGQYSN